MDSAEAGSGAGCSGFAVGGGGDLEGIWLDLSVEC